MKRRRSRDLSRICRAERAGAGAFTGCSFGDFHHEKTDCAALAAMVNGRYKPTRFRQPPLIPSTRQRTT
jgi:hypothetical protein